MIVAPHIAPVKANTSYGGLFVVCYHSLFYVWLSNKRATQVGNLIYFFDAARPRAFSIFADRKYLDDKISVYIIVGLIIPRYIQSA